MNDLQTKQLQILNSTIAHYNSSNRSVTEAKCQYAPIEGVSTGCAVGRLIQDKELCKELDKGIVTGISEVFNKVPDEVKELGLPFLQHLQRLHDNGDNWTLLGLSTEGKLAVDDIKFLFGLI